MNSYSIPAVLAAATLICAGAIGFANSKTTVANASECGCVDCRCPDCTGGACSCDTCLCGSCGCASTSSVTMKPTSALTLTRHAQAASCCAKPAATTASVSCACGTCDQDACTCNACDCESGACACPTTASLN